MGEVVKPKKYGNYIHVGTIYCVISRLLLGIPLFLQKTMVQLYYQKHKTLLLKITE